MKRGLAPGGVSPPDAGTAASAPGAAPRGPEQDTST